MKQGVYIWSLFLLLLGGCEQENIFTGELPAPRLVLYSFIEPDSLIEIRVSKTRAIGQEDSAYIARNVEGEIYINGQYQAKLSHFENDRYRTGISASAGDRVSITVRASGVPEANAETVIPDQFPLISADTFIYGRNIHFRVKISEQDPGYKYYRFRLERITTNKTENYDLGEILRNEVKDNWFYRKNEPLLYNRNDIDLGGEDEDEYNIYNIFSNETFRGKNYTLKISTSHIPSFEHDILYVQENEKGHFLSETTYSIGLYRIDEATYLYLKSEEEAYRGEGILSDPIKVYSNVNQGVGIIGSFTKREMSFRQAVTQKELYETSYNPFYYYSAGGE